MVRRRRLGVLLGAWALMLFEGAYLIAPASVLPLIIDGFDIGPAAAGWIVSAFFAGQIVVSVPVGVVFDLRDEYQVLGLASAIMLAAGIWMWWAATAGDYWSLVAARAVGGAAGIAVVIATTNLVGRAFAGEHEATALAAYSTAGPTGIALGQFAGPRVAAAVGWEGTSAVYGAGCVAAFAVLWAAGRGVDHEVGSPERPDWGEFGRALADRNVWHVGTMFFAAMSAFFFLSSWMPSYLTDRFGLLLAESGVFLGLFTAGGVVARGSGGVLSDRVFGRRRRPVALLSFGVTVAVVVGLAAAGNALSLLALLVVGGFAIQLSVGVFYTQIREVVDEDVEGTAVALFFVIGTLGALTAPVVTGALIDYTGGYGSSFGYVGVLAAVAVALAWFAPEG